MNTMDTHTDPTSNGAGPSTSVSVGRASLLRRLARGCYRWRRFVLTGWVLLTIGLSAVAGAAAGEFDNEYDLPGSESQEAFDRLEASGFGDRAGATIQLVVEADAGVEDPAVRGAFEAVLAEVASEVSDAELVSPYGPGGAQQIAEGGRIAYADVNLAHRTYEEFRSAGELAREAAAGFAVDGARLEVGGPADVLAEEEFGSEAFGLLAAVVILLIAFGSLLAMGLPLLTAAFGIACGTAIVQVLANVVTMPTFTLQLVLMLGIGVGIDYALFIVTRYRQALARGLDPEPAVAEAIDTAGRAVLFAGGTVVISVLGLFVIGTNLYNSLAIAAATGVLLTMLASVSLLPAVLGFVGHNIDRLGLPHRRDTHGQRDGLAFRWSRLVQRRPVAALVTSLLVLLVLAAPLFAIRLGFADNGNREEGDTLREAYDLLAEGFGAGFNGPLLITAELPNGEADLPVIEQLAATLRTTDGVAAASAPIPNGDASVAIVSVFPTTSPQEEATTQLVHRLRDEVVPSTVDGTGVDVQLGGFTAASVDLADFSARRLPVFTSAVLVLSFLLLMATFRSLLVPLKAVVMNLLSIGAAYGVIVAVFQWGWLSDVFGVGKPGPVESWAPVMLFAIVFGLSMDYEVFLLSRMKEEYDRTGNNAEAVADGLASTARVITAAAAIMFFVFAGFVLSVDRALQLTGLGLAVAVLVDATIVRLVLIPATMELLGDRNWWLPGWIDRILPRVHVEGTAAPAPSPLRNPRLRCRTLAACDRSSRVVPCPDAVPSVRRPWSLGDRTQGRSLDANPNIHSLPRRRNDTCQQPRKQATRPW
jgi:RND superfamily putative drug exporter